MTHALGEWVDTEEMRLPLMVLTYDEEVEGIGRVWMARSILTGHVASGSTEAKARKCLRLTVKRSIELSRAAGHTLREWFDSQTRAEPEYVKRYFEQAADAGKEVDWSSYGGTTVAMAPS